MDKNYKDYDIGVVIGRFQVPALHESHKKLFDHVTSRHEKVICFIGLGHLKSTKRNLLDFIQRKTMISEVYPNVICLYVKDCKSNERWSNGIDDIICDQLMPGQKALLYGSRDSFIKYYLGRFDTEELESDSFISDTEIRKDVNRAMHSSKDVRMGVVCGASNRFPTHFVCVDVAIMDKDRTRVLLARKSHEDEYRFVGGFSDPSFKCLEDDASREVMEETHCKISFPEYICSMKIEGWGYKGEEDSICTTFFVADYEGGTPEADDDIAEVRWFDISDFKYKEGFCPFEHSYKVDIMVGEHKNLMTKLLDHLNK
jgi:bifunctional NMN adenylyltransferase/nudix hydrolase